MIVKVKAKAKLICFDMAGRAGRSSVVIDGGIFGSGTSDEAWDISS